MPINTTVKTNPSNPTSQPAARPSVKINPPTQYVNKTAALKDSLRGATQPAAPRPAGSSARAEQFAKQQKYPTPSAPAAPQAAPASAQQKMSDVPPPPSGNPAERAAQAAAASAPQAQPTTAVEATPAPQPAQPATPAEATSEPASPHFAALARKERQLRKAQQDLKAQQEAWKQEQAKYVSKDHLTGPEALKTLSELGITYDRLVEMQISQEAPDPQKPLLDKIAQLEERLSKVDKTFEERDTHQEQQVLAQIRQDAQLLVDSDPTYETIKATDSVADVVDLIHKVFKAEGVILSVEEASQAVEEKLVEREYQRYQKLSQLQKIKSRLTPPAPAAPEATKEEPAAATTPQQPAQQQTQTTLTNTGSSTRPMSARERAIARLKGEI